MAYGTRKGKRNGVADLRRAWLPEPGGQTFAGDEPVAIDGRCFAYVFPCRWEDHCKIGFSGDPLGRLAALHPRWFEFFALKRGVLVEAESIRDARDLELAWREDFTEYNAPAPLAIRMPAGGHTEWFRGVEGALEARIRSLAAAGYRVHPLQAWLRAALEARSDRLYEWTLSRLTVEELEDPVDRTPAQRLVRDALDACVALDIEPGPRLAPAVLDWYRRGPC